jgi:hypothetical protein
MIKVLLKRNQLSGQHQNTRLLKNKPGSIQSYTIINTLFEIKRKN